MAGTSVIFRTAPDAINHLAQLTATGLDVAPMGLDDDGFLQIKLAL
jgi:hypothetical protein